MSVFNTAFFTDPYPLYSQLRTADPIHWDSGTWLVTSYADVVAVLRDQRFSARRIEPHVDAGNILANSQIIWQGDGTATSTIMVVPLSC